jgi:lambda repressor-like predicted transcriptional regulator
MVRLRVRALAEEKGISMARLSRLSDLSLWTIRSMWRDPMYDAGIQTLAKVARAMGVRVSELLEEGEDEAAEAAAKRAPGDE